MTNPTTIPLPEPDGSVWVGGWVQQGWIGKSVHAHAAAVTAAKDARIKALEDQLRLALAIIGYPDDDITKAMRAALGDKT